MEELERARKLYETNIGLIIKIGLYLAPAQSGLFGSPLQIPRNEGFIPRISNHALISSWVDRKNIGWGLVTVRMFAQARWEHSPQLLYCYDLMNYRLQRRQGIVTHMNFLLGDPSKNSLSG